MKTKVCGACKIRKSIDDFYYRSKDKIYAARTKFVAQYESQMKSYSANIFFSDFEKRQKVDSYKEAWCDLLAEIYKGALDDAP